MLKLTECSASIGLLFMPIGNRFSSRLLGCRL